MPLWACYAPPCSALVIARVHVCASGRAVASLAMSGGSNKRVNGRSSVLLMIKESGPRTSKRNPCSGKSDWVPDTQEPPPGYGPACLQWIAAILHGNFMRSGANGVPTSIPPSEISIAGLFSCFYSTMCATGGQ